jgi:hypothetical protein
MSGIKASSGLMHLVKELYRDLMEIKRRVVPEGLFNKTFFRHLIVGTGAASRRDEGVHALYEKFAEFRFDGTRYMGDADIYGCGAMKYLTNLKNNMLSILERFMLRSIFALYPGLSRNGICGIIESITNNRQHEDRIQSVDNKTSRRSRNEASVLRTAIQEHRAVRGLANPAEKVTEMKKDVITSS